MFVNMKCPMSCLQKEDKAFYYTITKISSWTAIELPGDLTLLEVTRWLNCYERIKFNLIKMK